MELKLILNLTADKKPENPGNYLIVTKKFKDGELVTLLSIISVSTFAMSQDDPFEYENKEGQVIAWAELPDVADRF